MEAQLNTIRERSGVAPGHTMPGGLAKRAFDILAAAVGLIVLSPLFVLVGVFIKRDSPGPLLYRGARVGRYGRQFQILKFRTMYEEPSSYEGPRVTFGEDQRVTPLGRWLRNTKLNELPQLWNVLVGEMSLTGPRPEDPEIVAVYPEQARKEILSVRPGITSPASVLYHSEENLLTGKNLMGIYLDKILPDKLRLDQLYVRNRSLTSDLDIIFWTLAIFIPRLPTIKIPEGYLFAGPFTRLVHRHFSWFLVDSCVAFFAVCAAAVTWRLQAPLEWGWGYLAMLSVCLALLFSTVNYLAGLNRIVWSKARGEDAFGLLFSGGFATLLALFLNYFQERHHWLSFPALPMEMLLSIGILASTGFLCVRFRFRLLTWLAESWSDLRKGQRGVGERVLIVGDGETCQIASWLLRQGMFRHAFTVVGIVASENPTRHGMRLGGCRVMGWIRDLPQIIRENDVRMIVYTLPSAAAAIRDMVFDLSRTSNVRLVFLDDLITFVSHHVDRPVGSGEYLSWLRGRVDDSQLHDEATGLPNFALLKERIEHSLARARRYKTYPALMLIDFNGLKDDVSIKIREFEDELMKTVSKRLMTFKRESDTLARLGVREFALLVENVPDRSVAETICGRTRSLVAGLLPATDHGVSMESNVELCFPVGDMEQIWERLQKGNLRTDPSSAAPVPLRKMASSGAGN